MNNNLSKFTAFAAALSFAAVSMCSCGDGNDKSYGNYNSYSNYNRDSSSEYTEEISPDEDLSETDEERPTEVSPNEEYSGFIESGFKDPNTEPLSTFSADVDTASFTNVRRLIEDGYEVPADSVRIEEFINYFDYNYPQPENGEVFGKYIEIADCPWNSANKLMMIGIQGKELDVQETPPSNIVFLIDSSGSMSSYDKLPLVQNAFSILAENLNEDDRISIVTYAGSSEIVLAGEKGSEKDKILEALYSIEAEGGTNGQGGIETAYELAEKCFIEGGNNRVILATDGDVNIGASTEDDLKKLIESKRDNGIYLSVLGFGTDNYKDNKLETLADNGNGNYSYIDSADEAYRVLGAEMSGTLFTIAKDVKIQVEFNPSQVSQYRLIGYDNRLMNAEDFYDESKDAGEVGAGHSVTALYEVTLADTNTYHGVELEFASEHKQDETADSERTELCKLSVTYKDIDTDESVYDSQLFGMEKYSDPPTDQMLLAGAVTEFGMILRNSEYKGNSSYGYVIDTVSGLSFSDDKTAELCELAGTADTIYSN